jgi:hypothetical protein
MYGAHAVFRQLPSLCIFNIAKTASSITSSLQSSSYSWSWRREVTRVAAMVDDSTVEGRGSKCWNQQVIAYSRTLMFVCSQPLSGCVGWALSSLMGTRRWIYEALNPLPWRWNELVETLRASFSSKAPSLISHSNFFARRTDGSFLYLASWSFSHYLALEMQVVGGLEVELTFSW